MPLIVLTGGAVTVISMHEAVSTAGPNRIQLPAIARSDHALLAGFRHSLRVLDQAIEKGAKEAGLTVQQQAFLLSLMARGARDVALADLRADLTMDQATTSDLLARLIRRRLVTRRIGRDRRALNVSMTASGRARFQRSVRAIGRQIRRAKERGDLDALQRNLRAYLAFYTR
jgi:DNA-binding MarR family transcriptional regulator